MAPSTFPSLETLSNGLATALRNTGYRDRDVTVLKRKPNPYNSTFPTEIVTCRDGHDSILRLFVKYGKEDVDGGFGHRGNVSYEARVYRDVLTPLQVETPTFYGKYRDKKTSADWLIVEYLPGGHRASWTRDPMAMVRSARWIGKFHAVNEARISSPQLRFLLRYDRDYYVGWARRTSRFFERRSEGLNSRFPWVPEVCERSEQLLPVLKEAPCTVIHGECFGSNIVYQKGSSRPIDWQSAAVAPGEIDLASLTLAWPKPFVRRLEREYAQSRWKDGPPERFTEYLETARLYMCLRWLGDDRLMSQWFKTSKRFVIPKDPKRIIAELHSVAERIGAT